MAARIALAFADSTCRSALVSPQIARSLDAAALGDKEEMVGQLRNARERTLAFLYETQKRDLSAYRWRHAFIGMLNVYEWFERIAAHQIRHTKQMKEIATELPKLVTSAENW